MNIYSHKLQILILFLCFISIETFAQQIASVDKMTISELSDDKLVKVEKLAKNILEGMENNDFYVLNSNDATPSLINKFTVESQKQFYAEKKEVLGNYKGGLKLSEYYVILMDNGTEVEFFRLESDFVHPRTSNNMKVDITMIYDASNFRLDGFNLYPWLSKPVKLVRYL